MRPTRWMAACALGAFLLTSSFALAQGQGKGHGKGHGKHGDENDQGEYYKDRDREAIRGWYDEHKSNLPPGLAKRDQPPPPPECAHVLIRANGGEVRHRGSTEVSRTS